MVNRKKLKRVVKIILMIIFFPVVLCWYVVRFLESIDIQ